MQERGGLRVEVSDGAGRGGEHGESLRLGQTFAAALRGVLHVGHEALDAEFHHEEDLDRGGSAWEHHGGDVSPEEGDDVGVVAEARVEVSLAARVGVRVGRVRGE